MCVEILCVEFVILFTHVIVIFFNIFTVAGQACNFISYIWRYCTV